MRAVEILAPLCDEHQGMDRGVRVGICDHVFFRRSLSIKTPVTFRWRVETIERKDKIRSTEHK